MRDDLDTTLVLQRLYPVRPLPLLLFYPLSLVPPALVMAGNYTDAATETDNGYPFRYFLNGRPYHDLRNLGSFLGDTPVPERDQQMEEYLEIDPDELRDTYITSHLQAGYRAHLDECEVLWRHACEHEYAMRNIEAENTFTCDGDDWITGDEAAIYYLRLRRLSRHTVTYVENLAWTALRSVDEVVRRALGNGRRVTIEDFENLGAELSLQVYDPDINFGGRARVPWRTRTERPPDFVQHIFYEIQVNIYRDLSADPVYRADPFHLPKSPDQSIEELVYCINSMLADDTRETIFESDPGHILELHRVHLPGVSHGHGHDIFAGDSTTWNTWVEALGRSCSSGFAPVTFNFKIQPVTADAVPNEQIYRCEGFCAAGEWGRIREQARQFELREAEPITESGS